MDAPAHILNDHSVCQANADSPLFSILMAVYNAESYLKAALQSVIRQTCSSWQLICVDDASTDGSLEILRRYAARDERITVIHKEKNQGQAVARNEALQVACGAYVMMLDADDWLSDDCLEKVAEAFTPETDSVVLRLMQHYEEPAQAGMKETGKDAGQPEADCREELYAMPYAEDAVLSGYEAFVASLDWTLHGLYAVRRQIHLRYPYDTSCHLYSDDNTTRLHYLHSREVRFCSGTYFYRKHAQSCTSAISADRFLYMQANLSMRQTLLSEDVPADIVQFYERHRWLNYIDQIWLFISHRHELSPVARKQVEQSFREVYSTFSSCPVPPKFGYTRLRSYSLFWAQERLYFLLRRVLFRR